MFGKYRFHCGSQSGQLLAFVRVLFTATAVARVDPFVGTEKHHPERQVVVEIEDLQVEWFDRREPDSHELIGDVFDLFETDNLPVEFGTVASGHAPHDDHQGFLRASCFFTSFRVIKSPAVRDRVTILSRIGLTLSKCRQRRRDECSQANESDDE